MRTNTIPAALAALFLFAGCDPETAPLPEAEDRREEVAADGAQPAEPAPLPPVMLAASDSATNYAPPGWPLSPGDTVTRRERSRLDSEWGDNYWGTAVVWVAGEGGPERSLPFGAGFTRPRRDEPMIYVGHVPMRPLQWTAEELEEDLPACLRGAVEEHRLAGGAGGGAEAVLRAGGRVVVRGARAAFLAGGIALAGLAVGIAAQWPAGCPSPI
jgi:hypothetical protein